MNCKYKDRELYMYNRHDDKQNSEPTSLLATIQSQLFIKKSGTLLKIHRL